MLFKVIRKTRRGAQMDNFRHSLHSLVIKEAPQEIRRPGVASIRLATRAAPSERSGRYKCSNMGLDWMYHHQIPLSFHRFASGGQSFVWTELVLIRTVRYTRLSLCWWVLFRPRCELYLEHGSSLVQQILLPPVATKYCFETKGERCRLRSNVTVAAYRVKDSSEGCDAYASHTSTSLFHVSAAYFLGLWAPVNRQPPFGVDPSSLSHRLPPPPNSTVCGWQFRSPAAVMGGQALIGPPLIDPCLSH